jgi:putative transposase
MAVAPSTYYAALTSPPSARAVRDAELKEEILRVHQENFEVYGARKIWLALVRKDIDVGRDRVARLMRDLGISSSLPRRQTCHSEGHAASDRAP